MIYLYPENLEIQLQKFNCFCYLLFGNDLLLIQECQEIICKNAKKLKFYEHFNIELNNNTDWKNIFKLCKTLNFFSKRQILILHFSDNNDYNHNLLLLTSLIHKDLILILRGYSFTKINENSSWFKIIKKNAIFVNCSTPEQTQLPLWIKNRAKKMKLSLDDTSCELLCYYYEGNLLALHQTLQQLLLIKIKYNKITLSHVKTIIHDASFFTSFHWINAISLSDIKRAIHILKKLESQDYDPNILLRKIQNEILHLLINKRQMTTNVQKITLNQYKIEKKTKTPFLTQTLLKKITFYQLNNAISLVTDAELAFKKNYCEEYIWFNLKTLTFILCNKNLPIIMTNEK